MRINDSKFTDLILNYLKQDKKPSDIRFLDFQIMRNASPVCDLVYYIFGCTTKYLRDEFYGEFLDVYYAELSSYMLR